MTPRQRRYARRTAGVGAVVSSIATIVTVTVLFAAPAAVPLAVLFVLGGLSTEIVALRALVHLP